MPKESRILCKLWGLEAIIKMALLVTSRKTASMVSMDGAGEVLAAAVSPQVGATEVLSAAVSPQVGAASSG